MIYRLGEQRVEVLGAQSIDGSDFAFSDARDYVTERLWRDDSGLQAAYTSPVAAGATVMRVRKRASRQSRVRSQILEKVFVFGARSGLYGLSILRQTGAAPFSDNDLRLLRDCAEVVLSCCDKHADLVGTYRRRPAFSSVPAIETALTSAALRLTERERQVCSRLLFGHSIPDIADDLGIRRKRRFPTRSAPSRKRT